MFRAALLSAAATLLIGCGSNNKAPSTQGTGEKSDVLITFDAANHACIVALSSEANGSIIPCAELIAFLRDELRLPKGASYETRRAGNVDDSEVAKTTQSLKDAGYRSIGGN